jgi:hypothetical protein
MYTAMVYIWFFFKKKHSLYIQAASGKLSLLVVHILGPTLSFLLPLLFAKPPVEEKAPASRKSIYVM